MSIEKNIKTTETKLNIELDWLRSITPQEILYLVDHCPFLQIVCPDPKIEGHGAEILKANTEWPIHFFGDAMSSSPGHLLFNGTFKRENKEEDGEAGGGKGTLVKQAWDTAVEMVEIAKNKGWTSINVVDGHPLMIRALWLAAEKMNIPLTGFQPGERDKQVRKQLELSPNDFEVLKKAISISRS